MAKVSRKQLLKKEDAFLAAAGQGAKWLSDNRIPVLLGSVAAVVVIFLVWGAVEYISARDKRATKLFSEGMDMMAGQILPEDSEEITNPYGDPPTFTSEEEKHKSALEQFQKVVDKTSSSPVALLARFYIADLYEKLGQSKEAADTYTNLISDLTSSDSLYFLAVERAAYLYEAQGQIKEATEAFARLTNNELGFYSDEARYQQARLFYQQGEHEQARSLFKLLIEESKNNQVLENTKKYLAKLGEKNIQVDIKADSVDNNAQPEAENSPHNP